ncbi:class I SAM-dependent methyltransferase [Rhodobacteraceae bacterium LMO-12]|nr:class I SAM-dependent methyltransferase [Rhodobacteraceae bacterium LMO-JJ12]
MALPESPISHLVSLAKQESCEAFKEQMEQSMLFPKQVQNRRYCIRRAIRNDLSDGLFIELGVAGGAGCRLFGNALSHVGKTVSGFDSFEGLEEDWTGKETGRAAGAFTQGGELPGVPDNVTLIKGMVQDTLPAYLKETGKAPFSFVHMDMDTYTPTRFALDAIRPRLTKGSIILFDELYGYPGWRHHEYKALSETLDPESYQFISFSFESVAIEMLRKPK